MKPDIESSVTVAVHDTFLKEYIPKRTFSSKFCLIKLAGWYRVEDTNEFQ
jgi:hypothetical protein